jgi:hypothetical protein
MNMNGQRHPLAPTPPDFDKMTWRCHCCEQERTDKYIKIRCHDTSALFGMDTGCMVVNVRCCVDMPHCQEKAANREWVINKFFKSFIKDENHKIGVPKP